MIFDKLSNAFAKCRLWIKSQNYILCQPLGPNDVNYIKTRLPEVTQLLTSEPIQYVVVDSYYSESGCVVIKLVFLDTSKNHVKSLIVRKQGFNLNIVAPCYWIN